MNGGTRSGIRGLRVLRESVNLIPISVAGVYSEMIS